MVCLESSPSFYSYYFQVTTILFCYRAASSSSKITAAKQPTSSSFTMTDYQTFANKLTIAKHSSSQQATITTANPVYIFLSGIFKSESLLWTFLLNLTLQMSSLMNVC